MDPAVFPLADRLRPEKLDDFFGQRPLTAPGRIVPAMIETRRLVSLIFWGPPGSGKTTLARILAREAGFPAREFSATRSGIAEIKSVMEEAAAARLNGGHPLVLFVDEIHHFNRGVQDAFLPHVERGDVILFGTTTENPAYRMNRALLSRLKILEMQPLSEGDLKRILDRGLEFLRSQAHIELGFHPEAESLLLHHSGGDSRRLLNLVELACQGGSGEVDEPRMRELLQGRMAGYDRRGDDRYQLISALHKSIRNSDLDAALFWLTRMLDGGEDPLYILRRLVRICVEDIGLADPQALQVTLNAKQGFEFLGSPEGDLFLCEAVVYLASAPKSNALYRSDAKLRELVDAHRDAPVPPQILNPDNFLSARQGAGKGYAYAHDFPERTTLLQTMPEGVRAENLFVAGEIGFEKEIKRRIDYWRKVKEELRKKGENQD